MERAFTDSKAREHIKEMIKLLQADDARWVQSHSLRGDMDVSYPCLGLFLDRHMMRELCTRAMKDCPRGTMAVVLATAASLVRYIRFPLLPHQSVHVPLAQLITHAMRISNSSLVKGNNDAFLKYKNKIDYNLVALVSTLWRKLSENPSLLEFFLFVDRRLTLNKAECGSDFAGEKIKRIKSQLDAIGCLIPLMEKAHIGTYAKQAILTAVAMKNSRIEHFIVTDTNLLDKVVTELCHKYQCVLDALATRDRLVLKARSRLGTSGALSVRANPLSSPIQRPENLTDRTQSRMNSFLTGHSAVEDILPEEGHESVASALDSFLSALRFCSALLDGSINISEVNRDVKLATAIERNSFDGSIDHDIANRSIKSELEILFQDIFLSACVRTMVLPSSSEQQVLSMQLLIRQIIQSLMACRVRCVRSNDSLYGGSTFLKSSAFVSPRRSYSPIDLSTSLRSELVPLSELTANYFIESPEFMSVVVSRAGAMSKAVVISTLQLIASLMNSCSFNSAVKCLFAVPWNRSDLSFAFNTLSDSHDVDSMLRSLAERRISGVEEAGCSVCLGYKYSAVPSAYVDAALKRMMARIFSFSDLETFFDISDSTTYQHSPDICIATSPNEPNCCASLGDSFNVCAGNISVLTVMFKKLAGFLTLKFDEQIALTGIISQISCLVATLLTVSKHAADSENLQRFGMLWHLNQIVESLYETIQCHLQPQTPNYNALINFVHNQLFQCPSSAYSEDMISNREQHRRPKELENPRVYQVVETAVLVEELLFESRAYVIAAFALRSQSNQSPRFSEEMLSPNVSPIAPAPCGSSNILGYSDDIEIEEDLHMHRLDSELNLSCLSKLDELLKEITSDVEALEVEYSKLNCSNYA